LSGGLRSAATTGYYLPAFQAETLRPSALGSEHSIRSLPRHIGVLISGHVMIQNTINHWAHHRGQMTVYVRLMGAKVRCMDHRRTTRGFSVC
jgi:uncharacterized damage-inducible protein DinB